MGFVLDLGCENEKVAGILFGGGGNFDGRDDSCVSESTMDY